TEKINKNLKGGLVMQKKPLIGLTLAAAVIALVFIGCSAVTPAPELTLTINPVGGIDPVKGSTVVFKNINMVDAIITRRVMTYTDTMGTTPVSLTYNISLFVSAEADSTLYTFMPFAQPMGSGSSYQVTFYGSDAYGYGKDFSLSTEKIWY
ncbi:MAG: hypothetical protein Q7W05_14620, partial [Deltaproteobacteria bacterium]|nr:hypothetical protein [Deltaproteobacteria bacterium]